MKIVVVGAAGQVGTLVVQEALKRGHTVTAFVRNPAKITVTNPKLTVTKGDSTSADAIVKAVKGQDAVVVAIGPAHDGSSDPKLLPKTAQVIKQALVGSKTRVIVVGGAGSLEVAPGLRLIDTPEFPDAWKPAANGAIDALEVYRTFSTPWTYFSPAAMFQPGPKKGGYKFGGDKLLTGASGKSELSYEDGAVLIVDELENPKLLNRRFTAAY